MFLSQGYSGPGSQQSLSYQYTSRPVPTFVSPETSQWANIGMRDNMPGGQVPISTGVYDGLTINHR